MTTATGRPRGIRPTRCQRCDRPLVKSTHRGACPDGWARYGGLGQCGACYQRHGQAPVPAAEVEPHAPALVTPFGCTDAETRSFALHMCRYASGADEARNVLRVAGVLA